MPGNPTYPTIDVMLMIFPRRLSHMNGSTALIIATAPKTLTSNCRLISSRGLSSRVPSWPYPALLTRTSIGPNVSFGPCNLGTDGCEIRDVQHDGSRTCGVNRDEVLSRRFASHRADHGISGRERFRRESPSEAGTSTRDQKITLSTHRHVLTPTS